MLPPLLVVLPWVIIIITLLLALINRVIVLWDQRGPDLRGILAFIDSELRILGLSPLSPPLIQQSLLLLLHPLHHDLLPGSQLIANPRITSEKELPGIVHSILLIGRLGGSPAIHLIDE